jgi:hypothetical protein
MRMTSLAPTRVAAFNPFVEKMGARLLGSARLRPTTTATTVWVRDGNVVIADGPFAETKEQIAGFLLVECENLDEAIEVASQIPNRPLRHDRGEAGLGDLATAQTAVAEANRCEWGHVVAHSIRVTGDWDLAEACARDAFTKPCSAGPATGSPRARPGG